MQNLRALRRLLPLAGPLRRYGLVSLVDAVGTGLFLTGSTLFFTRVLGLSPAQVGSGLSVAGLVALLGAIPLGSLGDRFGHRPVWIILTVCEAVLFATYPLVRSFGEFLAVVTGVALVDVGTSPLRGAYLALIAGPDQRVRVRAHNQAIANAGFVVGAGAAAVALQIGTRTAYETLVLTDAASYAVAAAVLLTLPAAEHPARRPAGGVFGVLRDGPFVVVSVLSGLLLIDAAALTVALPLWIVRRTRAPTWSVAAVFALETVLAVALQVRAARGSDTVRGAAVATRRAGLALLAACLVLSVSGLAGRTGALVLLAVAGILFTFGEVLQSAGAWGLSYGLAPPERQGQYLGAFAMGSRIYDAVGPLVVILLVIGLGAAGWVVLGVTFAVLAATLVPVSGWAERRHRDPIA